MVPAKRRFANPPLALYGPTAARWAWVRKVGRHAYADHRLSRVVGPGTGDDVLTDPAVAEIVAVTVCGVDGRFISAAEVPQGGRFAVPRRCGACALRIEAMERVRGQ